MKYMYARKTFACLNTYTCTYLAQSLVFAKQVVLVKLMLTIALQVYNRAWPKIGQILVKRALRTKERERPYLCGINGPFKQQQSYDDNLELLTAINIFLSI